ncbi:MAG: hypothetical protein HY083_03135 [Gammaproteobacteria bacterium]|nr:hypothetical protein [Gammaproteobacteria bacterium]
MKTPFLLLLLFFGASQPVFAAETAGADVLLAVYRDLRPKLEANVFDAPIYVESVEQDKLKRGEVYGVISYPFAQLAEVLRAPREWCAIALLHLNIKTCTHERADNNEWLNFYSGRKFYEPPEKAYILRYVFHVEAARADYLAVTLAAESGPLGTKDYRIALEAIPLGPQTFVHFRYAYRPSLTSGLATAGYLATLGGGKVGFSVLGEERNGKPILVSGVRGIVERNAMRYYLAIQAFLESLGVPETQRTEQRFQRWFELTERYPAQLHELEKADYLRYKRQELAQQLERQQALDAAATR